MVIIELQKYADFDVPCTDSVWVNSELNSVPPELSNREAFSNDSTLDNAIKALKAYDFQQVKTLSVLVGGNL